jgi:hypothetical protein
VAVKRGGLVVALILLAALSAYAWYVLRQERRERVEQWQPGEHLFIMRPDQIVSLEVTRPAGGHAVLRRGESGWELVEADREVLVAQVGDVLFAWSKARFADYVAEEAADLSQYGLDETAYRVSAVSRSGEDFALVLGKDSNLADHLGAYAQLNTESAVLLLEPTVWELRLEIDELFGFTPEEEREAEEG